MEYDSGTMILRVVINVVFTAAYYMAPMLIYRFLIYKNRVPRNKARKMCIFSGVAMYLILFVIYVATATDGAPNMMAAFLYTALVYWIVREQSGAVEIKGDLENQIKDYIDFYRKLYGVKVKDSGVELRAAIDEVFIQMDPYLKLIPIKELQCEIYKTKITVEEASLNIMQNFSMMLAKENITGEEMMFGANIEAEAAIAVYRYINDMKLEKKYISQFQYDENERLITAIRYNAPFI